MSNAPDQVSIKSALISVFDKTNLESLAKVLKENGVQVFSTGGTGAFLEKCGLEVRKVEEVTQFPEMMDGRVKTLHPRIFGGVLARRSVAQDMEEARQFGIPLFDLVVINLYPFWDHLGKPVDSQVPFIDIGGPSLIRAASKNSEAVTVLSSPTDYAPFIDELSRYSGKTSRRFRHAMAARSFARTAEYDLMIANEWQEAESFPSVLNLTPQTPLRYGENPHQKAAWVGQQNGWRLFQGKELSYNNLLDSEAALRLALEFDSPSVAIIKHNNPCGVAVGERPLHEIFTKALSTDSKSAFGGIVATNSEIDEDAANAMSLLFLEVVLAKNFTPQALQVFSAKKNLRLIQWNKPRAGAFEVRAALGGWLIQTVDNAGVPTHLKTMTEKAVSSETLNDLKFSWLVCKHVRSNAIVIAKEGVTQGIGAGQMSRVDAVHIALEKARINNGLSGAVLASDAFFPFRDNIDLLKDSGIVAIIQPGGSQRDAEVIQACNELGIAMLFSGERHFRH